jgi:excisionase family DNA binding protein
MSEAPYSPKMLAERWGCTRQFVHKLIREKKLPAFRIGEKLLRIRAEEVHKWEAQIVNTALEGSTDDGSLRGGKVAEGVAIASVMASMRARQPPN